MKSPPILITAGVALAAWGMALSSGNAQTAPPPLPTVTLAVEKDNAGHDRKGDSTTDKIRLRITVENRNKTDLKGLKLIWKILGRDVRSRKLVGGAGAAQAINLPVSTVMVLQTDAAVFTEIDEKYTPSRNKNQPGKTTPASGRTYRGFFVELYTADSRLIARACSPGLDKDGALVPARGSPAKVIKQDPPPPPKPPAPPKPPGKPAAKPAPKQAPKKK